MTKLTKNQRLWLSDVSRGEEPLNRYLGRSGNGGADKVRGSLIARNYLDSKGITDAGRTAMNDVEPYAAYLAVTTFKGGYVSHAKHYYGRVKIPSVISSRYDLDRDFQVEKVLTTEYADQLNQAERAGGAVGIYEAGGTTSRFSSEADVHAAAVAAIPTLFPAAVMLIVGETYIAEPQRIIWTKDESWSKVSVVLNDIFERFQRAVDQEDIHSQDLIWGEWSKHVKPRDVTL